jgi:hypothetical protein
MTLQVPLVPGTSREKACRGEPRRTIMAWIHEGSHSPWDQVYRSYARAVSKARELTRQYKLFVNAAQLSEGSGDGVTHNDIGPEPHSVACRCAQCSDESVPSTLGKGESMKHHDDIVTTTHASYRWDGEHLFITTSQTHVCLPAEDAVQLLELLYRHKGEL